MHVSLLVISLISVFDLFLLSLYLLVLYFSLGQAVAALSPTVLYFPLLLSVFVDCSLQLVELSVSQIITWKIAAYHALFIFNYSLWYLHVFCLHSMCRHCVVKFMQFILDSFSAL